MNLETALAVLWYLEKRGSPLSEREEKIKYRCQQIIIARAELALRAWQEGD